MDFRITVYGFDLVIVSACNSGTPGLIGRIASYTRYSIASPKTLHLSHISTYPFIYVRDIEEKGTYQYVVEIAQNAFDRLIHETNTAVTVALYDSDKILNYIDELETICPMEDTGGIPEYYDCAENQVFRYDVMTEGVTVFYRPPLFGPGKSKTDHSGWECVTYKRAG